MCSVCASSFSTLRLRVSPSTTTRVGTMLVARPPWMRPRLAVVSASTRPSFMPAMASLAIWMAESPRSGQIPACASRPVTAKDSRLATGARDQLAHAVHVENEAAPGFELPRVEVLCPQKAILLADAQDELDVPMGDLALAQDPDGFEDGHDARLVVATQHRGVIRAYDVALEHEADVLGGAHRVHVRGEEERRRSRRSAREASEDVARLPADLLPRIVHLHGGAHALEHALEAAGDGALAAREARDCREVEEVFLDARGLDHAGSVGRWRMSQSRLRFTASRRCKGSESRWSAPGRRQSSRGSLARSKRRRPWAGGTTSSLSPCTTSTWLASRGASTRRPSRTSATSAAPGAVTSSDVESASSTRLAGAFHVTTGSAGLRCEATQRATKPPRLEPSRPKRPSRALCGVRWSSTASRSAMREVMVASR